MPTRRCVSHATSSVTLGRAAPSASHAAIQLVVHSTSDTKIFVRRADEVGDEIRVSHHLKVDASVPKALAIARSPSDAEVLQIIGPVNTRLLRLPEAPDRPLLIRWLKESISDLGTPTTCSPVPAVSSPTHRRSAASTRSLELGSTLGQISPHHNYWRWSAPHWPEGITCNYPPRRAIPTEEDVVRVHALLTRLLVAAQAQGFAPQPLGKEVARELMHTALLRLQLLDPPVLDLAALLSAPAPSHFWFTFDVGVCPPAFRAPLDPSLLLEAHWLEENELLAVAARAFLGATPHEVLQTLRAPAELNFSDAMGRLLLHDHKPHPNARAAHLVVLAGGGPALRYLESAVATMGIAQVLRDASMELALESVVMNTAAGEYYQLHEGIVRLIIPHAQLRCNCPRRECAWGLGKAGYCAERYIPTTGAVAAFATVDGAATAASVAAAASKGTAAATAARPTSTRSHAAPATTTITTTTELPISGRRLRSAPDATTTTTTTTVTMTTEASSMASTTTPCWTHGTYYACGMRDLMATVQRALDEEDLDAALKAACSLNVLGRNGYNTHYISSELGPGRECFLNAHGTLKPDGSNHPWLEKISRVAEPFVNCGEMVILSLSDALPVSQSWATFRDVVDEGSRVAKLYAERCTDDIKESQVSVR